MGRLCLRRNDKARAPTGLAKELILSGYGPTIRHRENKRRPRQIEANEAKRKLMYEPGENSRFSSETLFVGVISVLEHFRKRIVIKRGKVSELSATLTCLVACECLADVASPMAVLLSPLTSTNFTSCGSVETPHSVDYR